MSHFSDFMEGIPVKISEKYKRPPRIELPYSLHDSTLRAQNFIDSVEYCSTFETNVLSKLQELRGAKETKKNERRHRLQLLEEEKQKKLDAIAAAEAEETLKQLSVSEVSYPSTDEISALTPDEKANSMLEDNKLCDNNLDEATEPKIINDGTFPSSVNQENPYILQPTPVPSTYQPRNLLDDIDPLEELKKNVIISKMPHYSNVEILTFKDFENDTSSPFDNVELKTINDMELLAQVLESQKESTTGLHQQQTYVPNQQTYIGLPNCASQVHMEGITYLPNVYMEQPIHDPSSIYTPQQSNPNGYYIPSNNVCDNMLPQENVYMPNYQYYVPTNPYPDHPHSYQIPVSNNNNQILNDSNYIPQPYYYHYPSTSQYIPDKANYNEIARKCQQTPILNTQNIIKSRSRSVPDIVRELEIEVELAKHRANERLYDTSPAPKIVNLTQHSSENRDMKKTKKKTELSDPYSKLNSKEQAMCQTIHQMGFPIDRVARVYQFVGDDDKKVIEVLLMMGELVDLGFTEEKIIKALAKNEFNKHKALDELVS